MRNYVEGQERARESERSRRMTRKNKRDEERGVREKDREKKERLQRCGRERLALFFARSRVHEIVFLYTERKERERERDWESKRMCVRECEREWHQIRRQRRREGEKVTDLREFIYQWHSRMWHDLFIIEMWRSCAMRRKKTDTCAVLRATQRVRHLFPPSFACALVQGAAARDCTLPVIFF